MKHKEQTNGETNRTYVVSYLQAKVTPSRIALGEVLVYKIIK